MRDVLIVVFMIVLCLGSVFVITTFLTKRAMHKVIRILKINGAVDEQGAKTIVELRLNPPALRDRLMRMRDYKPKALELLLSMNIVQYSEDGRVYLSEEKLLASPLVSRWPSLAKAIRPR
jgi:hypothetical protein